MRYAGFLAKFREKGHAATRQRLHLSHFTIIFDLFGWKINFRCEDFPIFDAASSLNSTSMWSPYRQSRQRRRSVTVARTHIENPSVRVHVVVAVQSTIRPLNVITKF